jgi:hypothetical protein
MKNRWLQTKWIHPSVFNGLRMRIRIGSVRTVELLVRIRYRNTVQRTLILGKCH